MTHRDDVGIDGGEGFELDERFADWVDGRLDPAELAQLEDELRRDEDLRAAADQYRAMVGLLRSELPSHPELEPPADLVPRVLDRLATPPSRRRLGPLLGSLLAAAAMISLVVILTETLGPGRPESEEELALNESSEAGNRPANERKDKKPEPRFRAARSPESERSGVAKVVGDRKVPPPTENLQKPGQGSAEKSVKPVFAEKSAETDVVRRDTSGVSRPRAGLVAGGKKVAKNRVTTGSDDWKLVGGERGRSGAELVDKLTGKAGALKSKPKALGGQAAAKLLVEGDLRNLGAPGPPGSKDVLSFGVSGQPSRSLRDLAFGYLKEVATLEEVSKRLVRPLAPGQSDPQNQARVAELKSGTERVQAGEGKVDSKKSGNSLGQKGARDNVEAKEQTRGRSASAASPAERARSTAVVAAMPVLVLDLPDAILPSKAAESARSVAVEPWFKRFLTRKKSAGKTALARAWQVTDQLKSLTGKVALPLGSQQYRWRAGDEVYLVHGDQGQLQRFFLDLREYLSTTGPSEVSRQERGGKNRATGRIRMRVEGLAAGGSPARAGRPEDLHFMLVLRRVVAVPAKRK